MVADFCRHKRLLRCTPERSGFSGFLACIFICTALVGCNGDGGANDSANNSANSSDASAAPLSIEGTPPTQVEADQSYSFSPTVTQAVPANISFSVQNKPSWATFSTATGQLAGMPTPSDVGTYSNLVISASNGVSTAALPGFAITVMPDGSVLGSSSPTWFGATLPTPPVQFSTTSNPPTPSDTDRGSYYTPGQGGDANLTLQEALNEAAAATGSKGDVIVLQAGTTYTTGAAFNLPARSGSGWIYIISSAAPEIGGSALPGAGTRVSLSNLSAMASLRTSSTGGYGGPVINRSAGAAYYRLVGLDMELVDANVAGTSNYYVVNWNNADTSVSTLAQYITIDRCYIDGSPSYGVRHAVNLDGQYMEITESYFGKHVFEIGNGDTNDVAAWNSTGPYKIHDNYLQAAGETTIFGGADTTLPSPSEPSDITITNNTYYKNFFTATGSVVAGSTTLTIGTVASGYIGITMMPIDSTGYIPSGTTIVAQLSGTPQGPGTYELSRSATTSATVTINGVPSGKNMVEFKAGVRVLFESNFLQNAGAWGQARSAFVLTSRNQSGGNPWYALADFTVENNFFGNCRFGGINILLQDSTADPGAYDTNPAHRLLFRNNLFILSANDNTSSSATADVFGIPVDGTGNPSDVIFDHNTFIATASNGSDTWASVGGSQSDTWNNFVWSNNIWDQSEYGFEANGSPTDFSGAFQGSTTSIAGLAFIDNVLTGSTDRSVPAGNLSPSSSSIVGYSSYGSTTAPAGYALTTSSPYHAAAVSGAGLPSTSAGVADGTDIGANIGLLPTG